MPDAVTVVSGAVIRFGVFAEPPPRSVATNGGIARPVSLRVVCVRAGSDTGAATLPGRPSVGTSIGGTATPSLSRVVRAGMGSVRGIECCRHVPPAGASWATSTPSLTVPTPMRAMVLGSRALVRSPMRVLGSDQSIASTAPSTSGSTAALRHVEEGQRYTYCCR